MPVAFLRELMGSLAISPSMKSSFALAHQVEESQRALIVDSRSTWRAYQNVHLRKVVLPSRLRLCRHTVYTTLKDFSNILAETDISLLHSLASF